MSSHDSGAPATPGTTPAAGGSTAPGQLSDDDLRRLVEKVYRLLREDLRLAGAHDTRARARRDGTR